MAALARRYAKSTEDFHRRFTAPQEDWIKRGRKWPGGYRWFKADNVVPIEYFKRPEIQATAPTKRTG